MPTVFPAGDVLEAGRALSADDRRAAAEELREERQGAAVRHRVEPRGGRRRERHLVDVRADARRDLEPAEPGAWIDTEGRERDAGGTRDTGYGEFALAAADAERALREVRGRVVRVEEGAARTEGEPRVESRRIRKRRRAVEDLDRRPEGHDARHRVARHRHRVERAAGVVGAAHRVEGVAVGREPEPSIGSGQARRIGGRNREVRRIGERDGGRRPARSEDPDRDGERMHANTCARASSRRDAVAIPRRGSGGVGSIFQGS